MNEKKIAKPSHTSRVRILFQKNICRAIIIIIIKEEIVRLSFS